MANSEQTVAIYHDGTEVPVPITRENINADPKFESIESENIHLLIFNAIWDSEVKPEDQISSHQREQTNRAKKFVRLVSLSTFQARITDRILAYLGVAIKYRQKIRIPSPEADALQSTIIEQLLSRLRSQSLEMAYTIYEPPWSNKVKSYRLAAHYLWKAWITAARASKHQVKPELTPQRK